MNNSTEGYSIDDYYVKSARVIKMLKSIYAHETGGMGAKWVNGMYRHWIGEMISFPDDDKEFVVSIYYSFSSEEIASILKYYNSIKHNSKLIHISSVIEKFFIATIEKGE
jgi:hypothetical protein